MDITDELRLDAILRSLGEQLAELGAAYELVVVGGASLQALRIVTRPTRDVDLVALRDGDTFTTARPLPGPLKVAADRVARDYTLTDDWLNAGPTDLLRWGLPSGFADRLVTRQYGSALTVHFAARYDLLHLKLYAMVDQGSGRHEADLRAIAPSAEELIAAARWTRTHDPSEGFRSVLIRVLEHLGISDADIPDDLRE